MENISLDNQIDKKYLIDEEALFLMFQQKTNSLKEQQEKRIAHLQMWGHTIEELMELEILKEQFEYFFNNKKDRHEEDYDLEEDEEN